MKSSCCKAAPVAGASRYTGHGQCSSCQRLAVFPEALDPAYQDDLPPKSIAGGVMIGLAMTGFLFLLVGLPKLSGPVAGGIVVGIVILGLGGYRNLK